MNKTPLMIIFIFVIILIFTVSSWSYLAKTYPTTSPLKSGVYKIESLIKPHAKMKKKTFGFLAYWRLENIKNLRLDLLTDINYFGLVVDANGDIIKETNNETDPGWREWNNQNVQDLIARTQIMGGNFSVTIISQNNDNINSILDNSNVQENLISNILSEVSSRKLDGINIDFEYIGEPDEEYKEKFTNFSRKLNDRLNKQSPETKLLLSIMPRSARDPDLFEFKELANIYDEFIGMSYDYSGISSDIATATAPLTGFDENKYFFDITTTYNDFLKTIPSNKILMGVPYYGWEWAVEEGRQIQSKTLTGDKSYAAVMSYARARDSKELKDNQCQYDKFAKQPWCFFTTEAEIDHQVWFENEQSISAKYDFAIEKNLGGIAIWILGYDNEYSELWNLMHNKFVKK